MVWTKKAISFQDLAMLVIVYTGQNNHITSCYVSYKTDMKRTIHLINQSIICGLVFLCMKFLILSKDKSKGAMFMRSAIYAFMIIIICSMFFLPNNLAYAEEQSIIIEVDGDPHERKTYLERYFPGIDVIKTRSEEHTSELQSRGHLVCRLL